MGTSMLHEGHPSCAGVAVFLACSMLMNGVSISVRGWLQVHVSYMGYKHGI